MARNVEKNIFTFFWSARFLIGLKKVAWRINWLPKSSFAPTGKGYDVISVLGVALPDGCGQLPAPRAHFGGVVFGAWSSAPPLPLSLAPIGKGLGLGGTWIGKGLIFPPKSYFFPTAPSVRPSPHSSGAGWLDLRSNNTFFLVLPPSPSSRAGSCWHSLLDANTIVVCECQECCLHRTIKAERLAKQSFLKISHGINISSSTALAEDAVHQISRRGQKPRAMSPYF